MTGRGRAWSWQPPGSTGATLAICAIVILAGADPAFADVSLPSPARLAAASLADATILGVSLRTLCLTAHVGGLILGMGGAIFLDCFLLRHLHRKAIEPQTVELLSYGGSVVAAGLTLLWLSGLGFLALYALADPEKLANPKLLAKFGIVLALTLNGALIHHFVFAWARQSVGRPLIAGASLDDALPLLTLGAISSASWFAAFLLGMVREMNDIVPAQTIFGLYLALIVVAVIGACLFHLVARRAAAPVSLDLSERDSASSPGLRPPLRVAANQSSSRTVFRSVPTLSIVTSTTSPGFMKTGGLRA